MAFPDRRTANILLTILLFAAVLAICYTARRILLIFVFAIFFAYLIDPVVRFLQRHSLFFKTLRGPHVVEAYLTFLLLIVFIGHALTPRRISINSQLFRTVPALVEGFSTGEIATTIGDKYGWSESQELRFREFLVRHREQTQSLVRSAEQFTSNAMLVLVVVPILAMFFLADGAHIANGFIQLVSTRDVREVAEELNAALRKYIRAKVILGVWSLVFYSAVMLLLRFPHAIALGVLGGILEFIPVAGWMISAAAIIAVGALTHSHWIWMAVLLGVWRMFMDYFISPRVVGQTWKSIL